MPHYIKKITEEGNVFLDMHIHDLESKYKKTDLKVKNPLTQFYYVK